MPRKPKGDKPLSKPYSFRLPRDQAVDLDERITVSGLTESEFLRDYVLKNRTAVVAKPKVSLEKRRLQFVFNKTSNNLNEIAHVLAIANQTRRLTDQLLMQAVQGLQDVAHYLKAALDHVD
jgi:hypothetical protein